MYHLNMEFIQDLNPLYAGPIFAVIICAFIVYAFGFKPPIPPPSFDGIEEGKKQSKKRRTKDTNKSNRSLQNGKVIENLSNKGGPISTKQKEERVITKIVEKATANKKPVKVNKSIAPNKNVERKESAPEQDFSDDGWVQQVSKKERKHRKKEDVEPHTSDVKKKESPETSTSIHEQGKSSTDLPVEKNAGSEIVDSVPKSKNEMDKQQATKVSKQSKNELKKKSKNEIKEETKNEPKQQSKNDEPKQQSKNEPKQQSKNEPKQQSKNEPKQQSKNEPKQQLKNELKQQPKNELKQQPKNELKQQSKNEAKQQSKNELKQQPDNELKQHPKGDTIQNLSEVIPDGKGKKKSTITAEIDLKQTMSDDSKRSAIMDSAIVSMGKPEVIPTSEDKNSNIVFDELAGMYPEAKEPKKKKKVRRDH